MLWLCLFVCLFVAAQFHLILQRLFFFPLCSADTKLCSEAENSKSDVRTSNQLHMWRIDLVDIITLQ